jgi:hypothetical protein
LVAARQFPFALPAKGRNQSGAKLASTSHELQYFSPPSFFRLITDLTKTERRENGGVQFRIIDQNAGFRGYFRAKRNS